MVQAARSGVQNIAEGSLASATSKKTELKLTGVARASLGELLLDHQDFLRQRKLTLWDKESLESLAARRRLKALSDLPDRSGALDLYHFSELSPKVFANVLICLINQTGYLLWQQMKTLEKDFLANGGFTEKMYRARRDQRADQR